MRRVPIRMKLAGALAVPLAALVVVTMLEVVQSANDARDVRQQTELAEATVGPLSLLSVLEDERNASAVYVLGQEASINLPVEDRFAARKVVDAAANDFRADVARRGGDIARAYAPALRELDGLVGLRARVDQVPNSRRNLFNIEEAARDFDGFSAIMDAFFRANRQVSTAIDNADLRQGAELTDLEARQTDTLARLVRDLLLAAVGGAHPDGVNSPEEIADVSRLLVQLRANEQLIAAKATGPYRPLAEALFSDPAVRKFPQLVDSALANQVVDVDGVLKTSAGDDPKTFGYTVFRIKATETLAREARSLEAAATARERWFAVLALLAVVVASIVTWLVSRSITQPLRSLTQQAKDMAEQRLPDAVVDILETPLGDDVAVPRVAPVRIHTRDEVADVADALNIVQDTALDLAVEQAVLRRNIADSFVNLGRRNQNLLGRQLDFITELETNETDPDTLANLFRLDHLATRMRRNAESLLVLAGIEPPRQWAAPVRLTDVIRAALGEVEDYQRVTVRGVEPATILGAAAADLAHLLAELVENALVFSPPDQTVDIRGRHRPGGYTLAIIDSGLGMPQADITAANRRLAGAESFTIAPSKYLGHYVAGNLAARHNITVHLDNGAGHGITATIDLPPTLLTTDEDLAEPVTPPHGHQVLLLSPEAQAARSLGIGQPAPAPTPPGWDAFPPAPPPPAPPGPPPVPEPAGMRTPSGLVKRSPGNGAGTTVGAGEPSGDLLDALRRHTANLAPDGGTSRSPAGLWGSQESIARRPASGEGSPASTGDRPTPPTWTAPSPPPTPPAWSPAAAGPSAPPAGPARWSPGPAMPPAGDPGPTASGLARRVRGAQMPPPEPIRVRRSAAGQPADGSWDAARRPPRQRSADDVYSFLTSFTAGVRRGLHEATDPE